MVGHEFGVPSGVTADLIHFEVHQGGERMGQSMEKRGDPRPGRFSNKKACPKGEGVGIELQTS